MPETTRPNKLRVLAYGARMRWQGRSIDWKGLQAGFVVSTGRVGTMSLARLANAFSRDTLALHEPYPPLLRLGRRLVRGEITQARAASTLRLYRTNLVVQMGEAGASRYLETNNSLSLLVPALRSSFPRARIVLLTRDPVAWVRSAFSKRVGASDQSSPLFLSDDDPYPRITVDDFDGDPDRGRWETMERFERLCWFWARVNRLVLENSSELDLHIERFKSEDIFAPLTGASAFRQLMGALEIPLDSSFGDAAFASALTEKSNATRDSMLGHYDTWNDSQKHILRRYVSETATELGYSVG